MQIQRPKPTSNTLAGFLWLLASVCLRAQTPVDYNDSRVFNSKIIQLFRSDNRDTSWITPDLRPRVIASLKTMMADEIKSGDTWAPAAQRALLALNDEETIEKLANAFHAGDSVAGGILEKFGREGALKYVAEDMFTGSPKWKGGADVFIAPVRMQAAWILAGDIANSPAFPQATRNWAKDMAIHLRQVLRPESASAEEATEKWWIHNAQAVLSGQYSKATWLPEETQSSAGGASHMPTPFPRLPQSMPESTSPVGQSPAPVPRATISNGPGSGGCYFIATIALWGLVGLGVWYHRRR